VIFEYLISFVRFLLCIFVIIGHISLEKDRPVSISNIHYFAHWLYGKYEPKILKIVDWLLNKKILTNTIIGRRFLLFIATMSHYLPHGIIVPTTSAKNLVNYIEKFKNDESGPCIAVGPCVCQMSLGKWKEPTYKDIVVLYGADIYLHLNRGYRIINAEEAVDILEKCSEAGLVHSLDFCMQSGKWHFVICNCDNEVCVLTRTFLVTKKMLYGGPFIVKRNPDKCLGPDQCGSCVKVCIFKANSISDGKIVYDATKCLGCGQCVRVCKGKSRGMVPRKKYMYDKIIPSKLLFS